LLEEGTHVFMAILFPCRRVLMARVVVTKQAIGVCVAIETPWNFLRRHDYPKGGPPR